MEVLDEEFSDVVRYIENHRHIKIEDKENEFNWVMDVVKLFKRIDSDSSILEIGTGIGWFPIMCSLKGLKCKGLEISPSLVEYAKELGAQYGVVPEIELGSIEDADIGKGQYDFIHASSVFEHVKNWEPALVKVYNALKPGGLFYFVSTNKFSLHSGEYKFPLYGWLPDKWRYALRVKRQGADIMKLGIDFNQFTYWQLRRTFRSIGFNPIYDYLQYKFIADPTLSLTKNHMKRFVLRVIKAFPPARWTALTFLRNTAFVCIKPES